jgi:hypothetical protein
MPTHQLRERLAFAALRGEHEIPFVGRPLRHGGATANGCPRQGDGGHDGYSLVTL